MGDQQRTDGSSGESGAETAPVEPGVAAVDRAESTTPYVGLSGASTSVPVGGESLLAARGEATLGSTAVEELPGEGGSGSGETSSSHRYHLIRLVARGPMSVVYEAEDRRLGRRVAMKKPSAAMAAGAFVAKFRVEARVTSQLDHPAVIAVYDLVEDAPDEIPFYTMKFVSGRTFKQAAIELRAKRAMPEWRIELRSLLRAFIGLCQGVAHAHSRGVVHRDLKGGNAMLGEYGEVAVLDWGLAKLLKEPVEPIGSPIRLMAELDSDATERGTTMGTWSYMAPEVVRGAEQAGVHTDVFGLGAILFEMLTARPPFAGAFDPVSYAAAWEGPATSPRAFDPALPPGLDALCRKAMARSPSGRYEGALALARDVELWLADEPVSAYRESWTARLGRRARRHRTAVASALVVLAASTVLLSAATFLLSRANARAQESATDARRSRRDAVAALQELLQIVSIRLAQLPGQTRTRLELVGRALPMVDKLRRDPVDPGLEWTAYRLRREEALLTRIWHEYPSSLRADDLALEILEGWSRNRAADQRYVREQTGFTLEDRAATYAAMGELSRAEADLRRAIGIGEALSAEDQASGESPTPTPPFRLRAMAWTQLAEILDEAGSAAEASAARESAAALWRPLTKRDEGLAKGDYDVPLAIRAALSHVAALDAAGRGREADERLEEVEVWFRRVDPGLRSSLDGRALEAEVEIARSGRGDEAAGRVAHADRAISLARRLAESSPEVSAHRLLLPRSLAARASALAKAERAGEAEAAYGEAVGQARELVAASPLELDVARRGVEILRAYVAFLAGRSPVRAAKAAAEAVQWQGRVVARSPESTAARRLLEELRRWEAALGPPRG